MDKILALWGTPRSRSTAFRWMMQQRGDFYIAHEPFGKSAYLSEERIFLRSSSNPDPNHNYSSVLKRLLEKAKEENVFIKDFPYYFLHIVDDKFLDCFQHTFLIRDPKEVIPSYYHKWPDLNFSEVGYQELFHLFKKVCDHSKKIPIVIDANDLIENPEAIVRKYCEMVGIPFMLESLNWEPPGEKKEIGWWGNGRVWCTEIRKSSHFENKINPEYVSVTDDEKLNKIYKQCLPYYQSLYQHRLKIP